MRIKAGLKKFPLYHWFRAQQEKTSRLGTLEILFRKNGNIKRVLDIGCGRGNIAKYFLERDPALEVVGIDISPKRIGCTDHKRFQRILFDLSVLQRKGMLPFHPESFDAVFILEVMEHLGFPQLVLAECWRVLKPGGAIFITVPNLVSLNTRLSILSGKGTKLFPRMTVEEVVAAGVTFSGTGHIAHYTFRTLSQLLSAMGFRVTVRKGAEFRIPFLHYIQFVLTRLFPNLSQKIVVKAVKQDVPNYRVFFYEACPYHGRPQLILPRNRCVAPIPYNDVCPKCPYFHTEWLHPNSPWKREDQHVTNEHSLSH